MSGVATWTAATLGVYVGSVWLSRRSGGALWALPVLTGTAGMLVLLASSGTAYADYAQATAALHWLIGPAVIALAVPLVLQRPLWLAMARPLALATLAGGVGAVVATGVLGTALTPLLLRRVLRCEDARVHAFTLGLSAHLIGTARALQSDPPTAALAALAMGLNAVLTGGVMAIVSMW